MPADFGIVSFILNYCLIRHIRLSIYTDIHDKARVVHYIDDLDGHTLAQLGGALGLHYPAQGIQTPHGIPLIHFVVHNYKSFVIYIV